MGAIIKSPVECFMDMIRASGVDTENIKEKYGTIRSASASLGMEIFNPINVAGWPGHEEWINENTLTRRWNYSRDIVNTLINANNREKLRTLAIGLCRWENQ